MKRDDLWQFAVTCYAMPGVEAACLELQDAGSDVCLLLAGAWLESRNVSCSAERLDRLSRLCRAWQADVVAPLRNVRRSWRAAAANDNMLAELRERVKALELDAERIQLKRMENAAKHWETTGQSADWLHQLSADATQDALTQLGILRHAAFAQLDADGGT